MVFVEEKVVALPPDCLDWTTPVPGDDRRKIVASGAPLEDCSASDGTTNSDDGGSDVVGRRATAGRRRTRDAGDVGRIWSSTSADNESLKTPDSLLTSELLDDSVFDGELDWIGASSFH